MSTCVNVGRNHPSEITLPYLTGQGDLDDKKMGPKWPFQEAGENGVLLATESKIFEDYVIFAFV